MTRSRLFISLCLASLALARAAGQAGPYPSQRIEAESDDAILSSVATGFFPRGENEAGAKALADHIVERAKGLGLSFVRASAAGNEAWHSYSETILVSRPGAGPDALIFAAPLNTSPSERDPISASISIALLLSLMEEAARNPGFAPGIGLGFAFIGNEYPPAELYAPLKAPSGSAALAGSLPEGRSQAIVYLDIRGTDMTVSLENQGSTAVPPYWLWSKAAAALSKNGFSVGHQGAFFQFYRAGLARPAPSGAYDRASGARSGGASAFLEAGIPAIEMASSLDALRSVPAFPAGAKASLIALAQDCSDGIAATWDRHYLVIDLPGKPFALREGAFVAFLLYSLCLIMALFVFMSLFRRRELSGMLYGFLRNAWALLFSSGIGFLAVWGSAASMRSLLALSWGPFAWTADPLSYMLCRYLLLAAFFAALIALALRTGILPSGISFYGAGAALLFFIDVFVITAVDASFSLYFGWAALFCVISILVRSRFATLILFCVTMAPILAFFVLVAGFEGESMRRILISPTALECLVLAFLFLPVVLHGMRCALILRREAGKPGKRPTAIALGAAAVLLAAASIFILIRQPYGNPKPLPLIVEESRSPGGTGSFALNAPSSMANRWIEADGQRIELPSGRSGTFAAVTGTIHPSIGVGRSVFLSRKTVRITVNADRVPDILALSLSSPSGTLEIYDASFPYTIDGTGKATISIGYSPRFPLTIELTVPKNFKALAEFEFRELVRDAIASPDTVVRLWKRTERASAVIE